MTDCEINDYEINDYEINDYEMNDYEIKEYMYIKTIDKYILKNIDFGFIVIKNNLFHYFSFLCLPFYNPLSSCSIFNFVFTKSKNISDLQKDEPLDHDYKLQNTKYSKNDSNHICFKENEDWGWFVYIE